MEAVEGAAALIYEGDEIIYGDEILLIHTGIQTKAEIMEEPLFIEKEASTDYGGRAFKCAFPDWPAM